METLEFLGKAFALDNDSHLAKPEEWSRAIAREGIYELTQRHWAVIDFMRRVYEREEASPAIYRIAKESGVDIGNLYKLFPDGPRQKAAKIAGLPRPKSYAWE
jgi:tRNA 2-thiouridine synthesizing protein E